MTPYVYNATVLRWKDGDTAELCVALGFDMVFQNFTVRLAGVNTPELHPTKVAFPNEADRKAEAQRGLASKAFSEKNCPVGSTVLLRTFKDKTEKYGRYLAELYPNGADKPSLNKMLLEAGLAKPFMVVE